MARVAFKMQLLKGFEAEYKRRHDELWPELQQLLKAAGIKEYSIFLDETNNNIFGVFSVEKIELVDNLRNHPIMQKWWFYMKDIMESNSDNSPLITSLKEVFYLP